MSLNAPRSQPAQEPETPEAAPNERPQEVRRGPETYELNEEDKIRIENEMKQIMDVLNRNVKTGGIAEMLRERRTVDLSGTERIALEIIKNHFRESLEGTLRMSAQRRRLSGVTASTLDGNMDIQTQSEDPYKLLSEEKNLFISQINRISNEYRRNGRRSGGDKIPPSELLARMNFGPGGHRDLLVPAENETAEQKGRREGILAFVKASLGMLEEHRYELDQVPGNEEIAGYIEKEFPNGDYMRFIWIAMAAGNSETKRGIAEEYIKKCGDKTEAIRDFLIEGNKRHVFSPEDVRRMSGSLFTTAEMEGFSETWEKLEEFTESVRSSRNIFDDRGAMLLFGAQLWGTVTALANIFVSGSGKSPGEAVRAILRNPYVFAGAGVAYGASAIQRGPQEKAPTEAARERIGREALKSSLEQGSEIHKFLMNSGGNEAFERGKFFLDYARSIGESGNASCKDFKDFLEKLELRKVGKTEAEKSIFDKISEDLKEMVGEGNLESSRINGALNEMVVAFRNFDISGHTDFEKIFREGDVNEYRKFVEEMTRESDA